MMIGCNKYPGILEVGALTSTGPGNDVLLMERLPTAAPVDCAGVKSQ
jgi:hypothetical protein